MANIKLLAYTMPHSFPEVWPIIINFCFGFPQGITALQILFIDLGTEILPGVSMAKEPPEKDVMRRPPRAMDKILVSNNLLAYR
jgi:sodium/potassium-transporting ATPase subunit alpha